MTDTKQVPHELRNKSAVGAADIHHGLSIAGPSGASSFRTSSSKVASDGDKDFAAFVQGSVPAEPPKTSQPSLSARSGTRAAQIAAQSFTPDDLKPRSSDSVDVVELLAGSVSLDDLDEALSFLSKRQEERQMHDGQLPPGTTIPSVYTSDNHPYLFNLLHLPDEEAITAYLSQNTYSNDVWGLPTSLKQDLDAIKDQSGDKEKALRRLTMLKRHLASSGSASDQPILEAGKGKTVEREEARKFNGFDHTDWTRIHQS